MGLSRSDQRLTIEFRRKRSDKVNLGLIGFVTVFITFFAFRLTIGQPPFSLTCTRATDTCVVNGHDIFGGSWSWHFAASKLAGSEVVKYNRSELKWIVKFRDGTENNIGNPSGRRIQKEQYKRLSAELQAFITDATRPSFSGEFEGLGAPPTPVFIVMAILLWLLLLRYLHGWYARLELDRAAGTVTAVRKPSIFGRGTRTFPLADVASVDIKRGFIFMIWSVLPTLTLRLLDSDGKTLFARREAMSRKTIPELEADLEAVRAFLGNAKN